MAARRTRADLGEDEPRQHGCGGGHGHRSKVDVCEMESVAHVAITLPQRVVARAEGRLAALGKVLGAVCGAWAISSDTGLCEASDEERRVCDGVCVANRDTFHP